MSYDVGLYMFTGIEETEISGTGSNYTYNVYAMLQLAFADERGINSMEAEPASACIPYLRQAIRHMEDNKEKCLTYNPPNGWGSYDGCLKWLRNILSHCEQHPLATLRIT